MKKIHENTIVGSNIEFKSNMAYGDGLTVFRRTKSEGEIKIDELLPDDAPEIFQFLSDSNYIPPVRSIVIISTGNRHI